MGTCVEQQDLLGSNTIQNAFDQVFEPSHSKSQRPPIMKTVFLEETNNFCIGRFEVFR
jgi:hypothetical protein